MNCLRRSKTWLSLWLIVAVLGHFGLGHHDASAFVLCFGADGHVAVEPAGHDHRSQASHGPKHGSITEKGVYVLKTGESPCTDIPVASEDHGSHKPLIESKDPSPDPNVLALAALVIAFIPFDELAAAPVFFPDPSIVDSRLPALRSVVLLI
ncbi:MAG TPA: hypothetical protein VE735_01640 [Gammaproteobacteria bacterium]|nr:hypothetical protein [Gammaproteobacteria bacterium]